MKNILIINHYAGSPQMGMEFRPYYFAREWVKMGHRVDIIAADFSHLRIENPSIEKDFQEELIDGIHYHWVHTLKYDGNGAKRALTMFQFVGKLMLNADSIARELKPDVVITSSTYPLDTYAGQRIKKCAKAYGINTVLIHEIHDMWPATLIELGGMSKSHPFVQILQVAEDSAYQKCDKLVSMLPLAESYMKTHGLGDNKFNYIPNGVVLDDWKHPKDIPNSIKEKLSYFKENGKFIVGYFGGHALSNSLDLLLDTAKLCLDMKDIVFVMVGKGVEKERLMQRALSENIYNVYFFDAINKKAIPNLLKYFDCTYIGVTDSPLYRFGLGLNKFYDAMYSGVPIILRTSAETTVIHENNCGIIVKSGQAVDVQDGILRIRKMLDHEKKEMIDNGIQAIKEKYLYNYLAIRFINVCQK